MADDRGIVGGADPRVIWMQGGVRTAILLLQGAVGERCACRKALRVT
jgi:hypothetical protein